MTAATTGAGANQGAREDVPLSLGTIAERNAHAAGDAEAVVDGARRLTWAVLHDRTARLADSLRTAVGAARGDRVAFIGENCLEAFELFHATARAGLVCVPLNDRLAPGELRAIIAGIDPVALVHTDLSAGLATDLAENTRTRLIPTGAGYEQLVADGRPEPAAEPERIASICFTSGTTGRPKGVMMTQQAQLTFARRQAELEPVPPGARHLFVRPVAVAPGHRMIAWHGLGAGTTVIRPRFSPADFFPSVAAERITNTLLAPTMLRMLLNNGNPDGHDLSSLVCILYGGAPMSPELLQEVLDFFPVGLMQGYGGTEAGQALYLSPQDHRDGRIDSNGRPVPGVDVEIRAPEGGIVTPGQVGELHVRSEMLMAGYFDDPAKTEAALRDGWYVTGDLAEQEPDGYIRVVGRVSDMIISGGFNIMPLEVETVLTALPAVAEAAVFGAPDPLWGESVQAAVVLRPGETASAEELIAACREHLASFKKPQRIIFLDAIPRTALGKIDKLALRNSAAVS